MSDRDGFSKGGWEVARAISCPASEKFAATISGLVFRMVWRVVVASFLVAMLHPSPCVLISAAAPNRVVAAGLSPGTGLTPGSGLGDISIHSRLSPQPRTTPEEGALAPRGGWEEEQEIGRDNGLDGMTELDEELDELERELDEAHEARAVAEKVNMQLKSAIEQQSLEIAALQAEINSTRLSTTSVVSAGGNLGKCSDCERQDGLVALMKERMESKSKEVLRMVEERERGDHALLQARKELRQSRFRLTQVMQDLEKVRVAGGEGVRLVWRCKGQLTNLVDEVAALRLRNDRLERERRVEEMARRKLHNAVQELKGNIRVYCRLRPLIGGMELAGGSIMSCASEGRLQGRRSLLGENLELQSCDQGRRLDGSTRGSESRPHSFNFDKVFPSTSSQADVFEEIAALVQSALDGYRVCIFAYGQTGSGKTYTMSAPPMQDVEGVLDVEGEDRGVIPRAVSMMFVETARMRERGWKHTVEVSFVEIYNEVLRDLLALNGAESKKLDIKHVEQSDGSKIAQVTHLRVVEVQTSHEVDQLLVQASRARATASTRSNEQSSRSHSVFVMRVRGHHESTGESCDGLLNLIDLAGSERLSGVTKAEGGAGDDRIRETQAINKSLSSLCDVISSLANKEQHVPFRNSKLTYLLQPSLGGDSKCLMFVNVSPARTHYQETLCSLRFASKVSSVQLRR